jgi:hypothetical protein
LETFNRRFNLRKTKRWGRQFETKFLTQC